MNNTERIMNAVAHLINLGRDNFTRREVRDQIRMPHEEWMSSYTAIFQGMRSDQPGGAPYVGKKYQNVFERIDHGLYKLTDYGRQIVAEFDR